MTDLELALLNQYVEFLAWLLPASQTFPFHQRQQVTLRLLAAALDLHEHLEAADQAHGYNRLLLLRKAELDLGSVRLYLRLVEKLGWLLPGQYLYAVSVLHVVGNMLATWLKQTTGSSTGQAAVPPQGLGHETNKGAKQIWPTTKS